VTDRRALIVLPVAALMLASVPARAEFFDDVKRTFQTDIPHFFQDDIPCAFGGQPTSGAKRSCHDGEHRAAPPAPAHRAGAPPPPRPKPDVVMTREPPDATGVVTREPPEYP
jgi:hypothetical protein